MKAKRILLVDDSKDGVELVTAAMHRQKIACEITVAEDGQEALDYLSGLPPADFPTIVLLDLNMPRIDGLTLLSRLRGDERTKLLPVIIFNSSDTEREIRDSYALGCNSYIRKPVSFERLCAVLQDLTRYWLDWNQAASPGAGLSQCSVGKPSRKEQPAE